MPKNKKGLVCLGSARGKKAVSQLEGTGYFNTADLNDIGQAFYNTFEDEGLVANDVVEALNAEWPTGTYDEDRALKIDDHFLDKLFVQQEAGAVLVAELAALGFKVVKERR